MSFNIKETYIVCFFSVSLNKTWPCKAQNIFGIKTISPLLKVFVPEVYDFSWNNIVSISQNVQNLMLNGMVDVFEEQHILAAFRQHLSLKTQFPRLGEASRNLHARPQVDHSLLYSAAQPEPHENCPFSAVATQNFAVCTLDWIIHNEIQYEGSGKSPNFQIENDEI